MCADLVRLPLAADALFDLVVCSYNTLDYVGHCNRLAALLRVRDLMAPGGRFVFSSHNRKAVDPAWPVLEQTEAYAVVRDPGLGGSLWTYYVYADECCEQLARAGFWPVTTFGEDGSEVGFQEALSPWLYYVAKAR